MKTLLLVDADGMVYGPAQQAETESFFGDDVTLVSDWKAVRDGVHATMQEMKKRADKVIFCFSDADNFRHNVLPTYKGNRKGKRKPLGYRRIIDELMESDLITKRISGLEADDTVSILATMPKYQDYEVTVMSPDKDLKQIPNVTLDRMNGKTPSYTTLWDADVFRWTQCLTGDLVDGYKGLPGYGPKKAAKALDDAKTTERLIERVMACYDAADYTPTERNQQIDCACILRAGEFNFTKKKPILFQERYDDSIPF